MSKKDEVKLSEAEIKAAKKEGIAAEVAESAAAEYRTKSATEGEPGPGDRWPDRHEIMQWLHVIDLGVEAFEDAVSEKPKDGVLIPEGKVAGLLELERSGKNRTPYVKACMKRLGVKSPYEVTSAGPDYTNDVNPVSKL